MENTQGISPLQALQLTETLKGLTDQQLIEVIACHMVFSPEAGKSITGLTGAKGDSGVNGKNGTDGTDGVTPVETIETYPILTGATQLYINASYGNVAQSRLVLGWNDLSAAPVNGDISYIQNNGATTIVNFSAALTGDYWQLIRTYWT